MGVDPELLTAVEQTYGAKTIEEYVHNYSVSTYPTMHEYLEDLLMPLDGIIGLHDESEVDWVLFPVFYWVTGVTCD